MIDYLAHDMTEVDSDYFKHLIAKAILFKTTEKIVRKTKTAAAEHPKIAD